jgi:predicted nuclease of predicted toxin-antitoxin system
MSTSIRYFCDEQISSAVTVGLKKRGIDVLTVTEAKLRGTRDEELLTFAADKKRIIVTQDKDFLRIAALKSDHSGIVYAPQSRVIGEMVRMLDLLAQVSDLEEMQGPVEYI